MPSRALAVIVVLLVALPAAGATMLEQAPQVAPPVTLAPSASAGPALFPADLPDADLVRLLAPELGVMALRDHPPVQIPAGLTLPAMVQRLAARGGTPISAEDAAVFADVDPRVAEPVLLILVATERAWDLRDLAFANVSDHELQGAYEAMLAHDAEEPRLVQLESQVDLVFLVEAAILLLDTVEGQAMPQLEAAAQSGAWPESAIADPVGVLRIGGTGNDIETVDRLLQVDARGEDAYYNNAGATTLLGDINPLTPDWAVALSLDFSGNDVYSPIEDSFTIGAAFAGIGYHYDKRGEDHYDCYHHCGGSGSFGFGMSHDAVGNDTFESAAWSAGTGTGAGVGWRRDDSGHDVTRLGNKGGGFGLSQGIGLLWDREGADSWIDFTGGEQIYGYGLSEGRGFFVDEGPQQDQYLGDAGRTLLTHACNDCTWAAGYPNQTGRGNDNAGGLAVMLGRQSFS